MRDALSIMDQAIASAPTRQTAMPASTPTKSASSWAPSPTSSSSRSSPPSTPTTPPTSSPSSAASSTPATARSRSRASSSATCATHRRQNHRPRARPARARHRRRPPANLPRRALPRRPHRRTLHRRRALALPPIMLRTFDELGYRQEQRFHLELGLLKLVHLQRLLPVEDLLTQLGATKSAPTPFTTPTSASTSHERAAIQSIARHLDRRRVVPKRRDPCIPGRVPLLWVPHPRPAQPGRVGLGPPQIPSS